MDSCERTTSWFCAQAWGRATSQNTNETTYRPEPHTNERDTLPEHHHPIARAAERATRTFHRRRARTHPDSNKSSRPYQVRRAPPTKRVGRVGQKDPSRIRGDHLDPKWPRRSPLMNIERACRSHAAMCPSYSRPTSPIIGEPHCKHERSRSSLICYGLMRAHNKQVLRSGMGSSDKSENERNDIPTRTPHERKRHPSRASSSDRESSRARNPNLSQASSAHSSRLEQVFPTVSSQKSSQARTLFNARASQAKKSKLSPNPPTRRSQDDLETASQRGWHPSKHDR